MEHLLHPWTSFVIVPLFALANAGVRLTGGSFDRPGSGRVAFGIVLGLVVGKPIGITLGAWLATRLKLARLPEGVRWPQLAAVAAVAGVGFTVSLFIADLAFAGSAFLQAAKVGVLAASLVAGVGGGLLVRLGKMT